MPSVSGPGATGVHVTAAALSADTGQEVTDDAVAVTITTAVSDGPATIIPREDRGLVAGAEDTESIYRFSRGGPAG